MRQPIRPSQPHCATLGLLGGFSLVIGDLPVALPVHAQRVLAYLALTSADRPPYSRSALAERLWSGSTVARSQASLRTALWRIRQASQMLVNAGRDSVRLADTVDVDLHRSLAQATRLLSEDAHLAPSDARPGMLTSCLLPGWEEDWLLLERERIRQVHVHALEALANRLRRLGRYVQAIEVAFAAIAAEPLRESAHAALIQVHLDEGNVAEARLHLDAYAALLRAELGIAPSPALAALVRAREERRAHRPGPGRTGPPDAPTSPGG
jgi:DNA-binding SARP family transcriptional activator